MTASLRTTMRRRQRRNRRNDSGMSARMRMLLALGAIFAAFFVAGGMIVGGSAIYAMDRYDEFAADVVPPEQLIAQQSRGGAIILDRNGEVLYEFVDELSGLRRPVTLDQISQHLIDATLAVEDPTFYENNGLNVRGLVRAGVENFAPFLVGDDDFFEGSGGSSITQQLAKNIYIPREQRLERSIERKLKETVIALELTEQYEKDQILEWYLNSISYGGIYTGIEAAAQGYFGKSAATLTLPEASLLAGIPQSPARYNPFSPENLDEDTRQLSATSMAKARQSEVLRLMAERSLITPEASEAALNAPLAFRQARFEIEAPHFVLGRIATEVTERFGERALFDQGLVITTTLDLNLQKMAEEVTDRYITEYEEQAGLYNGAFVAIDPLRGEILAYVGSRDYFRDDIEGRNDNAAARNSPGSTLKPFGFMTAFMSGWGTGTGVIAAPFEIIDYASGQGFAPRDPISQVLGPITAASALGNSLNTTAVKTIMAAGVPETIQTLKRVGYTTLDNPGGYGPALITGGGEVTLLDQVYAYSVLATNGLMRGTDALTTQSLDPGERTLEPAAILTVQDPEGRVIYEYDTPQEQRVVAAEYTYLVTSILSDGSNQCITYGACGALALPNGYPSAAKTGTSEPFENLRAIGETWTVGYTPHLVSGIWAGNADNAPIQGITSTSVSLRGWKDFMVQALEYLELAPQQFERPPGIVSREVCWPSGKLPTPACPNINRYTSLYAAEVLPNSPEGLSDEERGRVYDTWWQEVTIDTRTGLVAEDLTPAQFVAREVRLVIPREETERWTGYMAWAAAHGIASMVAPAGGDQAATTAASLPARIDSPAANSTLSGQVTVQGRATSDDMVQWRLDWGVGESPTSWVRINAGTRPVTSGVLGQWDTSLLASGIYSLRLVVDDRELGARRYQIPMRVENTDMGPTDDFTPQVSIITPSTGALVSGEIEIWGTAASITMLSSRVEFGAGIDPVNWSPVSVRTDPVAGGSLALWNTTFLPDGPYTIRVTVEDEIFGSVSTQVAIVVRNETEED